MAEGARPPDSRATVLGVESSLLGKRWESRLTDDRLALALAQRLALPEEIARVMAARGVDLESADSFLDPSLRALLPDPSCLKDMDRAAVRLAGAIEAGEAVAVFGDYDVDGATSAAVLARFFRAAGAELRIYIPDRLNEGYGPNAPALERLAGDGVKLVITVDCGITAFEALEAGRAAGLEVIVVDHHQAEAALPAAHAVVNPNRLDEAGGLGHLAAVGVTYLLVVALNRELRRRGWYGAKGEPDLLGWLDLVALGTVCDVVPLTGVNRAFVAQGLKIMARRGNSGLAALCDAAGVSEPPGTYHAGFLLGPRVNAGGRVGRSDLGARLLASDDRAGAAEIAARLDAYNAERKEIERQVLDQAIEQVERQAESGGPDRALIFAAAEGWHAGVIGIVASRLKDRYNLPAVVVALEAGVGKGSGRSVPGVDLGACVLAARQAGLLVNGGGHAMAAGLTAAEAAVPALRDFLRERIAARIAVVGYRPALGLDAVVLPGAVSSPLIGSLEGLAPFGVGNAEPRFALPATRVANAQVVGETHVRCRLTGADGGRLNAIAFRALDSALGQRLLQSAGRPLHIAGKLRRDSWRGGDAVQMIIEDAAIAAG